jgi:hypothetical protein
LHLIIGGLYLYVIAELFYDVKVEFGVKVRKYGYNEDQIALYRLDKRFMTSILEGILRYAKKLDPNELDYNEKVNHIIDFINNLTDMDTEDKFYRIYATFIKRVHKEMKSECKEKCPFRDYDNILQRASHHLANIVENLLEDPIKNKEQFYKSL